MTDLSARIKPAAIEMHVHSPNVALRSLVIGLTAFLTVVDLFATQAILPSLTRHYGVTPAAMGFAVNASTFGMAIASLVVGFFSPRIDRRLGILLSLTMLAVPTSLLAWAPNLAVFTGLRVVQGLCMASAFALTLAYLGEQCSAMDAGGAFAAYITGNVASNLVGRLMSAALADTLGLAWNFYVFAALNLAGAVLVYFTIARVEPMQAMTLTASPLRAVSAHWRNPRLRAAYGLGFCILFAFIGTFTFVNFVLVRPPLSLGMMDLGLVYLVFLPSVVTTLFAGGAAARIGTRPTIWAALGVAAIGLPLMLTAHLAAVLAGMVLVGAGTFFAQAAATGFVGQAAAENRGVASGTYLACYFCGGLAGTAVLGRLFDSLGWPACVAGIGAALAIAALLTFALKSDR
ncbi:MULTISPECIES: MFS transporter [unclassified Bradyrhizobium]|uniref:MFS transporter n=1 Tax=unclassified Bradyrhizobium TaxID=2631580 RepID=UPI00247AB11C|nr:MULTISPECIES: MFS transporter [unclassified Bradyrhizobium]WGR69229.1 MFS transporter [Bradyrhizobium sp. ISRA426]WGR81284.1 MFS transporter [Bradyrhizobium sp. ISRA430]WGR84468.1 MFS transporter [Bradyrhizobium sp. ISRA432]